MPTMPLDRRCIRVCFSITLLLSPALACQKKDAPPPAPLLAGVTWHTEEQWVVADIARHIARWQGRKETPSAAPLEPRGSEPMYRVAGSGGAITLKDYLWSPANFAPLVTAAPAPAATTCDTPDLLTRLLTPTVRNLVEADELLSKRIEEDPQNPCLHEAAAVLIAVFQMREVAFGFDDPRPALDRMTAHLAIARTLRPAAAPDTEGRLADLMLRAIAWRHDGFPEELKGDAAKASEPERTWLRVISLYSVQDWRELSDPPKATLAERLSYLHALANKTSPNRVLGFLDGAKEPIADWPRLAFARGVSVEVCGTYGEAGPAAVLGEITEVYRRERGKALIADELVSALNEESEDGASPQVLDWPLWAALEQRHLLAALRDQHDCLEYTYGLHEDAAKYRHAIAGRFGRLRLYPFLLARLARTTAEYQRAGTAAAPLIRDRPDVVTLGNWITITSPDPHDDLGPPPDGVPSPGSWFNPLLPLGTALDYNIRFTAGYLPRIEMVAAAQSHVFHVLMKRLYAERTHRTKPPVAFLKSLYGDTVHFDRDALVSIADSARETEPAEFLSAARAMCDMEADDCGTLAEYLKDHGDPDGAAREYQRWFDGARNRVYLSNHIEWLVNYRFDHGQAEKALVIAREAADTYSSAGLLMLAELLDKMKHYSEAEEYFQKEQERYDSFAGFTQYVAFLARHRDDPGLKRSLDHMIAEAFPDGPKPVRIEEFGWLRPAGATVSGMPHKGGAGGLSVGDVVVGVDGVRVNDLRQMRLQNRLSPETDVEIIYWRQGKATATRLPRLVLRDYMY
jgi:hypothetical protein